MPSESVMFTEPMMRSQRGRADLRSTALRAFAAAAILAVGSGAPLAAASPLQIDRKERLSAGTPLSSSCAFGKNDAPSDFVNETWLAAPPGRGGRLAAIWQRAGVFNALDVEVARTTEGGRSFERASVPGFSACTGGSEATIHNPWIALGRSGHTYATSFAGSFPTTAGIVAAHSPDGGASWDDPVYLDRGAGFAALPDAPRVTVDPKDPETAYLVWTLKSSPVSPLPPVWQSRFSVTRNAGATWSAPRTIYSNSSGQNPPQFNRIFVQPDGSLVNLFLEQPISNGPTRIHVQAIRSNDHGATWGSPNPVVSYPAFTITDPESPETLVDIPVAASSQAKDGSLSVAWRERDRHGRWQLLSATSDDNGETWAEHGVTLTTKAPILQPSIAVARDGRLGMSWYDLRMDEPGDERLSVRAFLSTSTDGGKSWKSQPITRVFDLRSLRTEDGSAEYLGGYQGMVGTRHGFALSLTVGNPISTADPSAVFFIRVSP